MSPSDQSGDGSSVVRGDYVGFDPGVDRPLHEVSRPEAERYFQLYLSQRVARREALLSLCAANGVALTDDETGLRRLNEWFEAHVEGDRRTLRLDSWWYVVVHDIGMWLGEFVIARAPHLEWRLLTGHKREESHQRPVVMGFRVEDPKYSFDPELLVAGLGARAIDGPHREPDHFEHVCAAALDFA